MKILILGANGLVGSSLAANLSKLIPSSKIISSTRKDTDLFSFDETKQLIDTELPDIIINAAAKVGGIHANNTQRTDFTHSGWGEEVVAFIVLAGGETLNKPDLDAHCNAYIARFKRPKRYVVCEDLPKNNYGKILKTELRKQI